MSVSSSEDAKGEAANENNENGNEEEGKRENRKRRAANGQMNKLQVVCFVGQCKMFAKQHELKLLNFGLVVYVCIGALLFHSLGDFEESPPSVENQSASLNALGGRQNVGGQQEAAAKGNFLDELRLDSVRRMWNITNRLNILYESNWTELVLAELVEFERKFVESLEGSVAEFEREAGEDGDEGEGDARPQEKGDKNEKQQQQAAKAANNKNDDKSEKSTGSSESAKQLARARLKSIKRALVHSLATITTMGKLTRSRRARDTFR